MAIPNCCRFKACFIASAKIDLPPYIRFEDIKFLYAENDSKSKPVSVNRFELISPLLLQLKLAFVGSRLSLPLHISNSEFDFVLAKLLPIFDACKHFSFGDVEWQPEKGSAFLASLLQHPSIKGASSVKFEFYYRYDHTWPEAELPIEAISNWLHKPNSGSKITEKRFLEVLFIKTENILEMIKHLNEAPNFCIWLQLYLFLGFCNCQNTSSAIYSKTFIPHRHWTTLWRHIPKRYISWGTFHTQT